MCHKYFNFRLKDAWNRWWARDDLAVIKKWDGRRRRRRCQWRAFPLIIIITAWTACWMSHTQTLCACWSRKQFLSKVRHQKRVLSFHSSFLPWGSRKIKTNPRFAAAYKSHEASKHNAHLTCPSEIQPAIQSQKRKKEGINALTTHSCPCRL